MIRFVFIVTLFFFNSFISMFGQSRIKHGIETIKVADNFYQINVHNFVNILLFNGPEGALLIDSGFEPVDLIRDELKKIGVNKVSYIINTHSDRDHVEGNSLLGQGAVIISSQRCRDMLCETGEFPPSGLPNITFYDSMSVYFNGEDIKLYFTPGHSSNDIIVHFKKSNIACIGDFGFSGGPSTWPGVKADVYDMQKSFIQMTKLFSNDIKFICGHTDDYSILNLKKDTDLITEAINLVTPFIKQGMTLEDIIKTNPLKNSRFSLLQEYSEKWIETIFNSKNNIGEQ